MDARLWFVEGQLEAREGRAGEPTILSGYAAVFGRETIVAEKVDDKVQRWRERIAPTAFDAVLGSADTIAAVNHDSKMVLGRTKTGSLTLSVDAIGLRYDVKLPNTTLARDTVENVRNGNYAGSSFKFLVKRSGMDVVPPKHSSDLPLITIKSVSDLIDVGPVTFPAYEQTSVSVRSQEVAEMVAARVAAAMRERLKLRVAIERAKAWGK